MENPATWGKAEHVVSKVHREWAEAAEAGVYGLSLARRVTDALRAEGLLVEEGQDPMDSPPVDHGSDRYDYVEVIGAPPGVVPRGEWFDRLIAAPCPDCRANVFITYAEAHFALGWEPWTVEIAHDDGCPTLAKLEKNQ